MPRPLLTIGSGMAPELTIRTAAGAMAVLLLASAHAQTPPPPPGQPKIYVCDLNGKRITSDRPILDCKDKEQLELNRDGSPKRVVPPTPTADERAEQEARERTESAARATHQIAVRRDRDMLNRFPNETAHNKAREKALDDVRASVRNSETRIKLLQQERKPLMEEAEFYAGKSLPVKLKSSLDANDASLEAQTSLVQNQQTEIGRINTLYDAELARLKKLWGGAQPGSIGPAPAPGSKPVLSAVGAKAPASR